MALPDSFRGCLSEGTPWEVLLAKTAVEDSLQVYDLAESSTTGSFYESTIRRFVDWRLGEDQDDRTVGF
jgi:hypothetical protein